MAPPNKTTKPFSSRLPPELILDIFSYLPTKSLQRLRYAFDDEFPSFSKSLETISFRNKHTFNILTKPTHENFLIEDKTSSNVIHEIDSYPFKPPSITHSYNFKKLFEKHLPNESKTLYGREIIGGCNGLICLYFQFFRLQRKEQIWLCPTQRKTYYGGHRLRHECGQRKPALLHKTFHYLKLWNPCTGEHHAIPTPQGLRLNLYKFSFLKTICGFGYDSVNKTYKLVIGEGAITLFYDISTDAWKTVETVRINWDDFGNFNPFNSWKSHPHFGYYLNGALHWIVSGTSIVSIDLSTEVNSFLNMPHCCSSLEDGHSSNMGVVKGCLSVSCHRSLDKTVSIWVMKEYGREESWTNILNIMLRESDMVSEAPDLMSIRPPLWVSRDDEMLFLVGGRLAYWDPKAEEFNYVEGLKFQQGFRGIAHVDTLVSPDPDVYRLGRGNKGEV